jgi:16S rRNA (guanine527-N7)-methyltransferase
MEQLILEGLRALSLPAEQRTAAALAKYARLLQERNQNVNLTAITDPDCIVKLHFLDSAALLLAAAFSGKQVIDVGTGAGFPGLVLKIVDPSIKLTLLDSTGKKLKFVREVAAALEIRDVQILQARAEEQAQKPSFRDSFDLAVSRAVADMRMQTELALPFVAPGGKMIAMKAFDCGEELSGAQNAVAVLGGSYGEPFRYRIPDSDLVRLAVVVNKNAQTPRGYPRRFSKIQKYPL